MTPGAAALGYAERRGWPVFPRRGRTPLTPHGYKDASRDPAQIAAWWQQWPAALIGLPTGPVSGIVVVDIDCKGGVDGFVTLAELGKTILPHTPMAHSPHHGLHLYFADNPHIQIGCSQGQDGLGRGLDVKGHGGSITLPTPGSGYRWDPLVHLSNTPFMPAPDWLAHRRNHKSKHYDGLRLKPADILAEACRLIRNATPGTRHATLNRQAFIIGAMTARGALDQTHARHELAAATAAMTWGSHGNARKAAHDLADAFNDGLNNARNDYRGSR